jgi:hypothetical protein
MRRFLFKRIEGRQRPTLHVTDLDNLRSIGTEGPSMEMAKRQAVVAVKQLLAKEESPMPECGRCRGGVLRTRDGIELCAEQECLDWYNKAITILDRVEVSVTTEGDVGEVVL